ncbi:MAG: hypothetical protein AAF741_11920 [Bacteroidota bacterium]
MAQESTSNGTRNALIGLSLLIGLVGINALAFYIGKLTLMNLVIGVAVMAALFTGASSVMGRVRSIPMSLLQHFSGILFVFSGWVKAADPMGTAFKMEQYFAEFESTFSDTALSFLAPMFPWFSSFSVGFSVFMIVLEIVLGLALIVGWKPKITSWLFAGIIFFFTFLTGFTYLTGYVPEGVNFFAFGQWEDWVETNMKVTDCGCFGDFLVLKPFTSFMKDIFLLVPSVAFLVANSKMHQLFTPRKRTFAVGGALAISIWYCLSNFLWNIPGQDFRPFRIGTDIAATKQAEMDAAANVQLTGYHIVNKESEEIVAELSVDEFIARYTEFPQDQFEYVQLKTEPEIEATKISDFELQDARGEDRTDQLLGYNGNIFSIVAYKIKGDVSGERTVYDTTQQMMIDTIPVQSETLIELDTSYVEKITERQEPIYSFDANYLKKWKDNIIPLLDEARASGHQAIVLTAFAEDAKLKAFAEQIGAENLTFLRGDDIMLKTIIRSNPGLVLLRKGKVLGKYHYRQLPSFTELANEYGLEVLAED